MLGAHRTGAKGLLEVRGCWGQNSGGQISKQEQRGSWGQENGAVSLRSQRDLGTEQVVGKKVRREQEKRIGDFSRECTQLEVQRSVLLRARQWGCVCVSCPNSTGQGLGCK